VGRRGEKEFQFHYKKRLHPHHDSHTRGGSRPEPAQPSRRAFATFGTFVRRHAGLPRRSRMRRSGVTQGPPRHDRFVWGGYSFLRLADELYWAASPPSQPGYGGYANARLSPCPQPP
jgi:hypothetical protein